MSKKIKDIIVRALKTFVQGFLGALAISIPTDLDITKSVLIGGVAGGISAVMNLIINLLSKEEE